MRVYGNSSESGTIPVFMDSHLVANTFYVSPKIFEANTLRYLSSMQHIIMVAMPPCLLLHSNWIYPR